MAKVELYRQYIQDVIRAHGSRPPSFGNVDLQMIFDTDHPL
ncbi:MAG: hypothetical protein AAF702_47850 [Chloroflexota bacterium]